MAGYIGSKSSVTQVDGYNRTEADDRYVNASGDTMTGALALPAGGLTVGTDQLAVDASGRVTMPYQPAISIGIDQTSITDVSGTALFGVSGRSYLVDTVVGIAHNTSNGRFTVPVSGRYLISFYSMKQNTGTAYLDIFVNGASWLRPYSSNNAGGWSAYSVCGIINLVAGDYVTPTVMTNSTTSVAHGLQHTRLVMQLIG